MPFSGDGPSWQAALAGHTDASANNLSIVYAQVKAGKLRAIGVSAKTAARDAEGIEHHVSDETLAAFRRVIAERS